VRRYDLDGAEVWTRQFGTSQATHAAGIAVNSGGAYVLGQDVPDAFRDEWETFEPFPGFQAESGAVFLAKFEKAPAPPAAAAPHILPGCIVNAASYAGGGVTPGEVVAIFGSAIGPPEPSAPAADSAPATSLAGTRILFNGVPAQLLYVSATQSTAVVPAEVFGQASVDVQVEYQGVRSDAVTAPVLSARPGLFSADGTGQGQGLIRNQDGSLNSPSNPAARGSVITLYLNGAGQYGSGTDGGPPVSVFFDLGNNEHLVEQRQAEVVSTGAAASSIGAPLAVQVRIPADAVDTGPAVRFVLFAGSHWTAFQVTLALR
jgi:uncharacterized protein (TIGR03437 family)